MSVTRVVYFSWARAPRGDAWADAVRRAGFALELEAGFRLREGFDGHGGIFEGVEGNFEQSIERLDRAALDASTLRAIGDRDASFAFITHSSFRDLAVAVIAAAVFCELTGGVIHDEDGDRWIAASEAIADARALIEEIRADL